MPERELRGKVYRGFSEAIGHGMGPETVFVEYPDGVAKRLKHEERHSPAGFSWGYGGSGPADLARSILADHLGYVPPPAIYQRFKWEYVSRWDQGKPWRITSQEIQEFIDQPGNKAVMDVWRRLEEQEP